MMIIFAALLHVSKILKCLKELENIRIYFTKLG
jgi:hypothetical protein